MITLIYEMYWYASWKVALCGNGTYLCLGIRWVLRFAATKGFDQLETTSMK